MEYTKLGLTDIEVSRICFGTLWIGGVEEPDAIDSIHRAIELGMTFIDTADGYGGGRSEKIVGKAVAGKRDRVIIATKCGLDKGQFRDRTPKSAEPHINMMGQVSEGTWRNSHPEYIKVALEASLERMKTDYVDLYQLHYPDSTTPWADSIGALQEAQSEGKIRAFGISNFSLIQLKEWVTDGPLHSLQPMYHMLERDVEAEILPFCRDNNIAVLPYSTLAHGLLTGKFHEKWEFGKTDFRPKIPVFAGDNFKKNLSIVEQLKPIALDKGITMAQLAIAWALAQPGITSTLVAAKRPQQVDENASAASVKLTEEDLNRIEKVLALSHPSS